MQNKIMSKKRPRNDRSLARLSVPNRSKMVPEYWRKRVFKSTYTYKGMRFRASSWSVKIQHLGQRKTFSLRSSLRRQAATEASELYRNIVNGSRGGVRARGGPPTMPAELPSEAAMPLGPDRFDEDFWAQRLIRQQYTMSLDMKPAQELSVQIDHQGTSHYFPLGTDDPKLAAIRALRIYQTIVSQGWKVSNERFRRELTVAFRWLDSPLAWTYTTIHTQNNVPRQLSAHSFHSGAGRLKVAIVESDGGIRKALLCCINHMDDFCCVASYASAAEALRELPRLSACLVLVSHSLADGPGAACLEELKVTAPGVAALLYSVYKDSDELFRSTPGGAGTYLLRRTPPNRLLEPVAGALAKGNASRAEIAAGVWQYFKTTVASLPMGSQARQSPHLTQREGEVLALLSKGQMDKEIAVRLDISIHTVHEHVRNIFEKLRVHNRTEAVVKLLQK
jgi:DNA-binding NarL/FixJ family response regulator